MTIRSSFRFGLNLTATIALAALACNGSGPAPERSFDVILVDGRVVDSTGAPWFRADLGSEA